MSHQDYVTRRSEKDPEFQKELALASAELQLATAIAKRRMERSIDLGDLAKRVGISEDRLEAIEDGDEITVVEALRLAHELDLTVVIEPDYQLSTAPVAHQAPQYQKTTA